MKRPYFHGCARVLVLGAVVAAGGCATFERMTAKAPGQPIAAQNAAPPVPAQGIATQSVPAPTPAQPVATQSAPPAVAPPTPLPGSAPKAGAGVVKPPIRTATAPASVSRAPAPQPAQKESAPAVVAKPAAPALDLKSLEAHLRETKAIGVLTKLTLKNQVDDLLDQFRMFYQGRLQTTLVELRRSYDLLVLKVLTLLQDADPPLATAIAISREAIWGILADPVKFATV